MMILDVYWSSICSSPDSYSEEETFGIFLYSTILILVLGVFGGRSVSGNGSKINAK